MAMEPEVRDLGRVVVMLMAGVINEHLLSCPKAAWPDDPKAQCEGCCPVCCAPCAALRIIRDDPVMSAVTARELAKWDAGWDWCYPDGTIRWEWIADHWKPDQLDCH